MIYEGRVTWVGADKFSKNGGVRAKIASFEEFFNVDGKFAHLFEKGATVKVKLFTKGNKVFVENAKGLAPPPASEAPRRTGGESAPASGGVDWAKKDASIQYQSSRKDALEFMKILLEHGALPLGSGKAAAKETILTETLDRITAGFFSDIESMGALKRSAPQREVEDEVEEDLDEVPEDTPEFDFDDDTPF